MEPQRHRGYRVNAEYKLLNALAEDLETNGYALDIEGTLYLYTEREMCTGCDRTLEDFQEKFPNLETVVFWKYLYRQS
ncbi:deaminase domain-containing protein [Spirulina sp. CS-785/01]|uniref:deaminase domain-containing protein n=1 Tax=Spirulina sp. CS-785/01 TaxID=3021716 RepID=UPI002330DAA4|nr:deaminase domain-containing protein [Spirulina sp. CS-785/01]MDB9312029.1 deaminase domain-containing protein [Spirulina sp. CS-785/01]